MRAPAFAHTRTYALSRLRNPKSSAFARTRACALPQEAPREQPKTASRNPKRAAQETPRAAQEYPKRPQLRPRRAVRDPKNDQRVEARETPFYFAETNNKNCLFKVVETFLIRVHGSTKRVQGCTKSLFPARQCKVCPPAFPRILCDTIKMISICPSELPKLIKKSSKT